MKQIFALIILTNLLVGCSYTLQTPEEFVDQYLNYVKEGNNDGLYNECYITSKSEIKKLMQELSRTKNVDNKRISQMHEATKEDRNRLVRKARLPLSNKSIVKIDSVVNKPQKIPGMGGDFDPTKGVRISTISAYLTIDSTRYQMKFQTIDLKTGKWKLANHPNTSVLD